MEKKQRLKDLKKAAKIKRPKVNKYEECFRCSVPILDNYPGRYQIGNKIKSMLY